MTCGGMFANKAKFVDHVVRQNSSGCKQFFIIVSHFMHSLDFNDVFSIYFIADESFQCSHCLKHCGSERILRDHMRHHGMLQNCYNNCSIVYEQYDSFDICVMIMSWKAFD